MVNKNYFVDAKNLRAGDILQTVNGKTVVVEQVQHEILESPVTVYNFEVEDNHNYFVGNSAKSGCGGYVLTHNFCGTATAGNVASGAGSGLGKSILNGLSKVVEAVGKLGSSAGQIGASVGQLGAAAGKLATALATIGASVAFSKTIADTKTDTKSKTKDNDERTEVHHIVARNAALAKGSKAILEAAGLNVEINENKVPLNYTQHKHLHTNRYHARVFMDMLKACVRVLDNSTINGNASSLLDIINNLDVKPSDIRQLILEIKGKDKAEKLTEYLEEIKSKGLESKLGDEIKKTLLAIAVALKKQTYMSVGIKL